MHSLQTVEPFAHAHVLVVDADADTRELHALTLRPLTPDIETVGDGAEALASAIARPPSLVLMEMQLPRIDGVTLCGLLRSEPNTRESEILVVTASAERRDAERAIAAGADGVLVKPIAPDRVRDEARRLLVQSMQLRERSAAARARLVEQVARSQQILERSENVRRRVMSRTYRRETTATPPQPPPELRCPDCFGPLTYERSHVGGVSQLHPEQWDDYNCSNCGPYQYRHRTRRLRRI